MKRLYTLSSCCCVYLIILLLSFFQRCPPKFAMPLDLRPYPLCHFAGSIFPHIFTVLSSLLLHWRFSSRRNRGRQGLPIQSLRNTGVCLTSVPFLSFHSSDCSLITTLSHISSATAFYTITCFTRLPLLLRSAVGHCAHIFPSINQLFPILTYIALFSYPVRPSSFQISLTA